MKMNWKIRFENIIFILQIIGSAALAVLAYMGITLPDLSSWSALRETLKAAVSNPYIIGLFLWNLYCASTDPTTKGIGDSVRALRRYHLGDA